MANCRLVQDERTPEFRCPHCNGGVYIDEWYTEYGDPILYDNQNVLCPWDDCDKMFVLKVKQTLHYYPRKREDGETII
jgi:hypothetical protein